MNTKPKFHKVTLRQPRTTQAQKVKAITLYNAGVPVQDILTRTNISQGTFYKILNQEIEKWSAEI